VLLAANVVLLQSRINIARLMSNGQNFDRPNTRRRSQYWKGLSDHEVMKRQIDVADPESLPNLLAEEPLIDEIPEIEFEYDTLLTGGKKLRCVHCKKTARNHNRGFVLQYADGRRMLIGKDCGQKLYGAEWGGIEHDFKAIKSRRALLEQRQAILTARAQAIPLIEQIAGAPCWEFYWKHRRSFVHAFPDLAGSLGQIVNRNDGALMAEQRVRDELGEAEYKERTGRDRQPLFKNVQVEVGRVSGKAFFQLGPYPGKEIEDLTRRLISALHVLGNDDAKSNHDLKMMFVGIRGIITRLTEDAERCDSIASALSVENLGSIARWLTVMREGKYAVKGGQFLRHDAAGNPVRSYGLLGSGLGVPMQIDIPASVPPSATPLVARLRELLAG
jgi:hypothetical protein